LVEKVAEYIERKSRASIAWIIGEYANNIVDRHRIFQTYFIESFLAKPDNVKLQGLTISVKLYLKLPDECEEMIKNILKLATEQASNPDIKDRAYIYWRMLSTSPSKTLEVVCGAKPRISLKPTILKTRL
jgi:vesicle coat complex subunit